MFQLAVYSDHTGFLPPKQARKAYKKPTTKLPINSPLNSRSVHQMQTTYTVQNARRRDIFDEDGEECFFCSIEEFCASFWMVFVALIIFIVTFTMMYSESDVDTDFGTPVFTTRSTHRHYDVKEDQKFHQNLPCDNRKNLVFLSHNRTASMILTNILQQFGYKNNLRFAIPTVEGNDRCTMYFNLSSTDIIKHKFNIICNPTRFDHKLFSSLVPEDAKYFTMLRNPVNPNSIQDQIFNVSSTSKLLEEKCMNEALKGQEMMYNFGFDSLELESGDQIKAAINWVEKTFGLVMIEEHFDESLLLLKKYLCWTTDDIVYFTEKHNLTARQNSAVKSEESIFNAPDYQLYKYFNETLWKMISNYGPSYDRDFHELQLAKMALRNTCKPRLEAHKQKREVHALLKTKSRVFQKPSLQDCLNAVMNSADFTRLILEQSGSHETEKR